MIHRLTIRDLMTGRLALAASLALASSSVFATTYTLEPDYTQGVFRWNHLGLSSPAAQFAQGQGALEYLTSQGVEARAYAEYLKAQAAKK
jgi:polyisoprenoid-binding protein YceI